MGILILTIGALVFMIGYVWTGLDAMKYDPEYGKWAFLSGVYRFNYCRANWNRTSIPCSMTVLGLILILVGILM
ncbi:MAG: hypothetical protein JW712_13660 [Dehalococcoidales bacterium]|nr:hypothetical protein [Dehalococcoidales bacterium]